MLKFKFFILSLATILISCISLSSCEKDNADDAPSTEYVQQKGEYKVELTFSGDLNGFKPSCDIMPFLPNNKSDSTLYDMLGNKEYWLINYEYFKTPEIFDQPIIVRTSKDALGIKVWVRSYNELDNHKKITIHAKGYFKNKLIKEETKEITNEHTINGLEAIEYEFKFGDPAVYVNDSISYSDLNNQIIGQLS